MPFDGYHLCLYAPPLHPQPRAEQPVRERVPKIFPKLAPTWLAGSACPPTHMCSVCKLSPTPARVKSWCIKIKVEISPNFVHCTRVWVCRKITAFPRRVWKGKKRKKSEHRKRCIKWSKFVTEKFVVRLEHCLPGFFFRHWQHWPEPAGIAGKPIAAAPNSD